MTPSAEAQQLLRQGRTQEAKIACEKLLESSPDDVESLVLLAMIVLHENAPFRALALLERAERCDGMNPLTFHHQGRAHEAMGNDRLAVDSHRKAVGLAPEFHVARLFLAGALERTGDREAAVVQYARALQDAQQQGHWLNPDTTPPPLRPTVEHAVVFVREGRRKAFGSLLDPLIERYGREALVRVEKCLRIHMNEAAPEYPDPRQRPTFLYFPDLPASAYHERRLFAWIEALEAETDAIRAELIALLPSAAGRERVFADETVEQANLRGLDTPPSWNGYYFFRHGEKREENCARCPRTTRALEQLPLSHVRAHGPEVLYSIFTPGTHLLPHRGITNTRLVSHLPLMVPENCALKVGGELHEWQEGRVVVFDDTYEHEAWNRGSRTRVVMIYDIWNPNLTEAERAAVTDLVAAIGDFREAVEAN